MIIRERAVKKQPKQLTHSNANSNMETMTKMMGVFCIKNNTNIERKKQRGKTGALQRKTITKSEPKFQQNNLECHHTNNTMTLLRLCPLSNFCIGVGCLHFSILVLLCLFLTLFSCCCLIEQCS